MDKDFSVLYSGSICILTPVSKAARDWVYEHISADAQWFGGGVVVEHRYIHGIVAGIVDYGLTIN